MQVEKSYTMDYTGAILRSNYFVLSSMSHRYKWRNGYGSIKISDKMIIGDNSKFMQEVQRGDKILFINPNKVQETFNLASTNPILSSPSYSNCIVKKVLSNNILITNDACKRPYGHKGDYYISKSFYKNQKELYSNIPINKHLMSLIDLHTIEILSITKLYKQFYPRNYLFHPGFIIRKKESTMFRMKLERMYINV